MASSGQKKICSVLKLIEEMTMVSCLFQTSYAYNVSHDHMKVMISTVTPNYISCAEHQETDVVRELPGTPGPSQPEATLF